MPLGKGLCWGGLCPPHGAAQPSTQGTSLETGLENRGRQEWERARLLQAGGIASLQGQGLVLGSGCSPSPAASGSGGNPQGKADASYLFSQAAPHRGRKAVAVGGRTFPAF